jgi:hypothetical protein
VVLSRLLTVGETQENRVSFRCRLLCNDCKMPTNWEGLDAEFVLERLGPIDPQVATLSIDQDENPRLRL